MNNENISGTFIVFGPITCKASQPQKTNGFLCHRTDLVLNLFQKTFVLTYMNLNFFFLSESQVYYGSEKCVSGLWLVVATALDCRNQRSLFFSSLVYRC